MKRLLLLLTLIAAPAFADQPPTPAEVAASGQAWKIQYQHEVEMHHADLTAAVGQIDDLNAKLKTANDQIATLTKAAVEKPSK